MARALRGTLYHCLADPGEQGDPAATEIIEDGLLLIDSGRIAAAGPADVLLPTLGPDVEIHDHRGCLLLPGLIDCHVHFAQLDIIASYGEQLLHWLEDYAYPAEQRFADPDYAKAVAEAFLDQLLANGTTTALVFATVHAAAADALFEAAAARQMRLIAGKVLMDSHCPEALRDTAESGYAESRALIERWHGHERLGYAITPRFALTSSEAQLRLAGQLAGEFDDVWIHTHLAENHAEVAAVAAQFPWSQSYLDVYARFALVRERAVFAHCLHLEDRDCTTLADRQGAVAFCPTSNLFLGSGLLDLRRLDAAGIRVGLATDVGGGTSLSQLRTMGEAYKVLQLQNQQLPLSRALYLATLGAARALGVDDAIGNFATGKEADLIVLDPEATPATQRRNADAASRDEQLFATLFLGDERNVVATWVNGKAVTA